MSLLTKLVIHIELFNSYRRLKPEILKQSKEIAAFVLNNDFKLNPHKMFTTVLKIHLAENEKIFGKPYCPMYEPTEDKQLNEKLVCPCSFASDEIANQGHCGCGLFGRSNYTSADFAKIEQNLKRDTLQHINIDGDVLDCRGRATDPLRKIAAPSPLAQVRQALNLIKGHKLSALVTTNKNAENIRKYAELKKFKYHVDEAKEDLYIVGIVKKPVIEEVKSWQ